MLGQLNFLLDSGDGLPVNHRFWCHVLFHGHLREHSETLLLRMLAEGHLKLVFATVFR